MRSDQPRSSAAVMYVCLCARISRAAEFHYAQDHQQAIVLCICMRDKHEINGLAVYYTQNSPEV